MAYEFKIEVFGETVIERHFMRFSHNAADMTDTMRRVAAVLSQATAENFRTAGRSGGSPWRELADSTKARKKRLHLDPRILIATERLYHSLVGADSVHGARSTRTGRFAPGGKDHIEEAGPDSLRWGSSVEYGVYHQSSRPRRVIPYRPPVALNERVKAEITRTVQRGLMEGTG